MQSDGNVVIYDKNQGNALWASNTGGSPNPPSYMLMYQSDSNVVVYATNGNALIGLGTYGYNSASLQLSDDGILQLVDSSGGVVKAVSYRVKACTGASASLYTFLGSSLVRSNYGVSIRQCQGLMSSSGRYIAVMQSDANFAVYDLNQASNRSIWATDTGGRPTPPTYYVIYQGDGNVVLYDDYWNVLWAAQCNDYASSMLRISDTGILQLVDFQGNFLYAVSTNPTVKACIGPLADYQFLGSYLTRPSVILPVSISQCQGLLSPHGNASAVMQSDGNFVIYSLNNGTVLWTSNTASPPSSSVSNLLSYQVDGNVVIYSRSSAVLWSLESNDYSSQKLVLTDEGNLQLTNLQDQFLLLVSFVAGHECIGAFADYRSVGSNLTRQAVGPASLRQCQGLISNSGQYKAVLQSDGNFVVYDFNLESNGTATWASNTGNHPNPGLYHVDYQDDGNVAVYNGSYCTTYARDLSKGITVQEVCGQSYQPIDVQHFCTTYGNQYAKLVNAQAQTLTCAILTDASGCFPADAKVMTPQGWTTIDRIRTGDAVAVSWSGSEFKFEPVYANGHEEQETLAEFVRLDFASETLELTPKHFVPVFNHNGRDLYDSTSFQYKRAEDVEEGDILWQVAELIDYGDNKNNSSRLNAKGPHFSLTTVQVVRVSRVRKQGLFNPYTLSGNLLVNSIQVSCHSDWVLDPIFDGLHLTHWLPHVYQTLLAPLRGLHRLLGLGMYQSLGIDRVIMGAALDIANGDSSPPALMMPLWLLLLMVIMLSLLSVVMMTALCWKSIRWLIGKYFILVDTHPKQQ